MDKNIQFSYDGKEYEVGPEAYDTSYIVLPDSRVIQPLHWLESLPPQLGSAQEVDHSFKNLTPAEIAENLGKCTIAWEI